ncbi:hypothetical protein GCM10012275_54400 [Longimycelium tulufanense]|uniref:Uncharacterized protein n=1 Tax=Longimycelium tulufanense TaxID=907463 RepID=A0A8J3CJJ0_9PSEU|nr:hypothetical protein [Longimycelium tulufanense]GGM76853.1 hypothetical protein GCM10012275_54400 [Longimycelium tulufanense]
MGQVNQPTNTLDRIKRLERELNEVRKAIGLSSATISRGGLTVQDGAFFQVLHPTGHTLLLVSQSPGGQYFIQTRRDNGTVAHELGEAQGGLQFWSYRDNNGAIIVSDDAETGWGLATPHLTGALYPSRFNSLEAFTSSSFEEIFRGVIPWSNPYLWVSFLVYAPTGVTVDVQLTEGSGVNEDVLYTDSYTDTFLATSTGKLDITTGRVPKQALDLRMWARISAGSGEGRLGIIGIFGEQS